MERKTEENSKPKIANLSDLISHSLTSHQASELHQKSGRTIIQDTFGGFADGGTNIPAGRYKVGERGPEIMDVPGESTIYPNGTMPSYSSGSGSGGSSNAALLNAINNLANALASQKTVLAVDGRELGQAVVQHRRVLTGTRN